MFNEVHKETTTGNLGLAFIKSLNIQAFPCGRRRSNLVDRDRSTNTTTDQYYIPFDPEARLNTEANNRKHSSLNGFTQTYIADWGTLEDDVFSLVLAGYQFKIKLEEGYTTTHDFGTRFIRALKATQFNPPIEVPEESNAIYANIRLEPALLFEGFIDYRTEMLRNQSLTETPEATLDLLITTLEEGTTVTDENNFYFSGLSFTLNPLSGEDSVRSDVPIYRDGNLYQRVVSLKILEKTDGGLWQLCQQALLPQIEHGDTEGSIKLDGIFAKDISAERFQLVSNTALIGSVPAVKVVYKPETDKYQLQFLFGKGNPAGGDADVPESGGDGGGGGDLMRKYGQLDVQYFILK